MSDVAKAVEALAPAFAGRLILPSHADYHDARALHNGMIDKKPALVAQCRGAADAADAVMLARKLGLEIAVRGGGHNVAGRASVENGVVVDLSLLRQVNVDPAAKRAWVGGGALWRDFNRESQLYGLATTGGVVSTTGVAGLTLGGGFGWLMPKYGMALDNLRSARVVLADSKVVKASADENPDLFWAIRGGGGNFGVVTSFEFQLHEVGPMVYGGLVAHPFDRARDLLRFFRDTCATLPDDIFLVAAMLTAPDGSGAKLCAMGVLHSGSVADGERALKPIKTWGSPVMDVIGPMPYSASNMMLDGAFPKGARNYWKSRFMSTLTDEAIDTLIDQFKATTSPMNQVVLENFHGAATRVPVGDTAFALRSNGFNVAMISEWLEPADDAKNMAWCKGLWTATQKFAAPISYLNYLAADDTALSEAYGPNLERLRKLKKQYDPENVFRQNMNIQ